MLTESFGQLCKTRLVISGTEHFQKTPCLSSPTPHLQTTPSPLSKANLMLLTGKVGAPCTPEVHHLSLEPIQINHKPLLTSCVHRAFASPDGPGASGRAHHWAGATAPCPPPLGLPGAPAASGLTSALASPSCKSVSTFCGPN